MKSPTFLSRCTFLQSPFRRALLLPAALLIALVFLDPSGAQAQTSYTWTGGGGDNNFGTSGNWGGTAPSSLQSYLNFAGTTRLNPNNNYSAYSGGFQIYFNSGAGAFTLTGNAIKFFNYGGGANNGNPNIQNDSTSTQTVNIAIGMGSGQSGEFDINANSGNMVFGSSSANNFSYFDDTGLYLFVHAKNNHTVTFWGPIGNGGANAKFALDGGGTVFFNAVNTYTGETDIDAGNLQVGSTGSINAGSAIFVGSGTNSSLGEISLGATTGGQTFSNNFTVNTTSGGSNNADREIASANTSGTNTFSGTVTLNSDTQLNVGAGGTLDFSGKVGVNSFTAYVTGSGTVLLNGAIDNTNLGLVASSGTTILAKTGSGNHAVGTGLTVNNGGTVQLGNGGNGDEIYDGAGVTINSGGVFDLNGQSEAINVLNGAGTIMNSSNSAISTLTTGAMNGGGTFSGVIGGGAGTLALTDTGSGTLTLTGSNTYTGLTTITSGATLQLGAGGATGSLVTTGTISDNGTLIFNRSNATTQGTDFSVAAITGSGSLVQSGSGVLTLSSSNGYSGGTTVNNGTLNFGTVNSLGAGTITLGNGTLQSGVAGSLANNIVLGSGSTGIFDTNGNNNSLTGTVSGSGGLTKISAGNLTLSGSNSYSGTTTISAGTVQLSNSNGAQNSIVSMGVTNGLLFNSTASGGGTFNIGGLSGGSNLALTDTGGGAVTLVVGNNNNSGMVYSGVLSGSGALVKVGTGTQTLTGSNTFTGGVTINSGGSVAGGSFPGQLIINSDAALGAVPGSFNPSAVTVNGAELLIAANTTINANRGITVGASGATISSSGSATVIVNSPIVNNSGSNHLFLESANATILNGGISGSGDIVKEGAGTVTLNGSNSFLGTNLTTALYASANVYVDNGTAQTNNVSGFGPTVGGTTGAIGLGPQFNNGQAGPAALVITGSVAVANPIDVRYYSFADSKTLASNLSGGTATFSGPITLHDNVTLAAQGAGNLTISGAILPGAATSAGSLGGTESLDGTPGITVNSTGAGAVILTASNSYAGATGITAGILNIQNSSALGNGGTATVSSGATLQVQNGVSVSNALGLSGVGAAGATGALESVSGSNSYTGQISLNASSTITSDSGSTLTIAGSGVNIPFSLGLTVSGAGTTVISGPLTSNGNNTGGFLKVAGPGTVLLQGTNNTYTGNSTSALSLPATEISGGTLGIYGSLSLGQAPAGPYDNIQFLGTGTLQDTANTITLGTNRNISVAGGSTATFDNGGNTFTLQGIIHDSGGSGSVTTTGSGTTVLTGKSTYTGPTTVSGGTLLVSGSITSAVTVNNGATLSGTGGIGAAVSVAATGGTILPGLSGTSATLNTGALDLSLGGSNSILSMQLGAAVTGTLAGGSTPIIAASRLNVNGSANISGADLLTAIIGGYTPSVGDTLFLIDDSSLTGTFGEINGVAGNWTQGSTFSMGGYFFQLDYQASYASQTTTGGSDVALEVVTGAVPEPETWAGIAMGAVMLAGWRRVRKTQRG